MSFETVIALFVALAGRVHAVAEAKATADAAFQEGKELTKLGETAKACAKFETSVKLLDRLGARLNLADCYERLGKLSAAYVQFRVAEIAARRAHDWRAPFAGKRLVAVAKRLAYLKMALANGANVGGLEVTCDGQKVDISAHTVLPIDPGTHVLAATAPGRNRWSKTIQMVEGSRLTIEIPILQSLPRPRSVRRVALSPRSSPGDGQSSVVSLTRHRVSLLLSGAGGAALGAGLFYVFHDRVLQDRVYGTAGGGGDASGGGGCGVCDIDPIPGWFPTALGAIFGTTLAVSIHLKLTDSRRTPDEKMPARLQRLEPIVTAHGVGAMLSGEF